MGKQEIFSTHLQLHNFHMLNFGVHELNIHRYLELYIHLFVCNGHLEAARFKPYIASNGTRFVSLTTVMVLNMEQDGTNGTRWNNHPQHHHLYPFIWLLYGCYMLHIPHPGRGLLLRLQAAWASLA